jgi:hypothetical protein
MTDTIVRKKNFVTMTDQSGYESVKGTAIS